MDVRFVTDSANEVPLSGMPLRMSYQCARIPKTLPADFAQYILNVDLSVVTCQSQSIWINSIATLTLEFVSDSVRFSQVS